MQREALATLRAAVESNREIDDSLLQALLDAASGKRRRHASVSGDFFLVFGTLVAATGLCLGVLAVFVPDPRPFIVVAICAETIAGSLFLLWRVFSRRKESPADSSILP